MSDRGTEAGGGAGKVVRRRLEESLGRRAPVAPSARRAIEFGRDHLTAVVIIALAGCLWAGYSITQARTLPVAAVSAAPATPSQTPARPTTSTSPHVLIHVIGAVQRPGVVSLPVGSRVQDALAAAGGLRADARPGELNLAAVVTDGSQILVGTATSPGAQVRAGGSTAQGGGPGASGPVNLNTASVEELDALPGVGPVTAQAIVAWRTKHGRFSRVEELGEVDGIGPKILATLTPKVSV